MKYRLVNATSADWGRISDLRQQADPSHRAAENSGSPVPGFGSGSWMAAFAELRSDDEMLNARLGDEAKPERNTLKRDRTAGGRYKRRIGSELPAATADDLLRDRTLESDSATLPAELPSAPVGSTYSPRRSTALGHIAVSDGDAPPTSASIDVIAQRWVEALVADLAAQRQRKKSLNAALKTEASDLPPKSNDLAEPQANAATAAAAPSDFTALRDALREKQRQLRLGGKG